MRFLPVFLDLQRGPVLLVGAGDLVRAKLRLLVSAGARVRWYATDGNHDLSGVDAARVEKAAGDPLAADLQGVIAILCAGAGDLGIAMSARARSVGLPVNVMDDLAHSTFIFPAIVDRGDVVVAVGTGGASPVVARRVRERIEAVLPARIGDLAGFIGSFRKTIHARIPEFALRRRFWERVVDGPIGALVLAGHTDEAAKALNEISDASAFAGADDGKAKGHVTLVGAGPGDPGLLTLNALRALQEADVILHDRLVSAEVLGLARRDATKIEVGKRARGESVSQARIHELMLEHARAGRRVVRLKGGDPFVFGRGGEELECLSAAGIPYEVVPGITAALACGAYAGIPLTHRDHAQSLRFVTAHDHDSWDHREWSAAAAGRQTLCLYMGVTGLGALAAGLLAHGRGGATPVAVIENGTRADQRVTLARLDELADLAARGGLASPALVVVGEVAALASELHWFGVEPRRWTALRQVA